MRLRGETGIRRPIKRDIKQASSFGILGCKDVRMDGRMPSRMLLLQVVVVVEVWGGRLLQIL